MRVRDQCSIFSIGLKFRPDYGPLLELHTLTRSSRPFLCALGLVFESSQTYSITSAPLREICADTIIKFAM